MIFEPELETMPREQLEALQAARLSDVVARVRERVFFYRERLAGFAADSLEDLPKLPFTRKSDLRDHYPVSYTHLTLPTTPYV